MSPAEQINPFPEVRDSVKVTCTHMPESDSEERAVIFRSAASAVPPGNIPSDRASGRIGRVQQLVQAENQGEFLLHTGVLEPVREM